MSGTWANTTYFPETTDQAPAAPPAGFQGVLSRAQWKGVIDFAKAVNAEIVTSFATSMGTRDAAGAWTTGQAKRFLDYTKFVGGRIAAAEFMNQPTLPAMGGAPAGYDAADYGRDFKVFHAFAKEAAPGMLILGPGSVGETTGEWGVAYGLSRPALKTRDLLAASRPASVDAFSYHHYGMLSQRCAGRMTVEAALSGGVAPAHRRDAQLLSTAPQPVLPRQGVLGHGGGRRRLRRKSVGARLSGHLPLSGPAWPLGETVRRSECGSQLAQARIGKAVGGR